MTGAILGTGVLDRRRALAWAVLGALGVAWVLVAPGNALQRLDAATHRPWFSLLLIGLYAVRGPLGWPITMLSALVGYRYGLVLGFPIALGGAVGTSLITWALARGFPTEDGLLGRLVAGGRRYFRRTGDVRGVAAARLAPTPAAAVSAAAGASGVAASRFVLGTLLGVLPWTVAAVAIGASLGSLSAAGRVSLDPMLIVGFALGAVLLLAKPAYRVAETRGWVGRSGSR